MLPLFNKHWFKCLRGLGPGWATAWGVRMNRTRSYSCLYSCKNISLSLFFSACVCHVCMCICAHACGLMCVLHVVMCAGIRMHKCAYSCGFLKLLSGVPFSWVKKGLWQNLVLAILWSLASQFVPGVPRIYLPGARITGVFLSAHLLCGCRKAYLQAMPFWGKCFICFFWCQTILFSESTLKFVVKYFWTQPPQEPGQWGRPLPDAERTLTDTSRCCWEQDLE